MEKHIYLIGINHKTAPVEVRERFALTNTSPRDFLEVTNNLIDEVLCLSTCNRVEIIFVAKKDIDPTDWVIERWAFLCGEQKEHLLPCIYSYRDTDAIFHLFEVASSLDSMVVGEPQILGQLKEAYKIAADSKTTKSILNRLMHRSFSVAKRIRTETKISHSAVSISYAAVELAKRIFSELDNKKAMLIGAGEMAELAAQHLINSGVKDIVVVNRTLSRAKELAKRFSGVGYSFSQLFDLLVDRDIVISSTGASEPIIHQRDMKVIIKKRKYRPMFFIDIAVPRDIDPDVNNLDNVYLYDIDDLKDVVSENLEKRAREAEIARSIIKEEVQKFETWLRSLSLNPTIKDLIEKFENIAEGEVKKSFKRLSKLTQDPEAEEILKTLASSLIKKFSHYPITFLKNKSTRARVDLREYTSLIRDIFELDEK